LEKALFFVCISDKVVADGILCFMMRVRKMKLTILYLIDAKNKK